MTAIASVMNIINKHIELILDDKQFGKYKKLQETTLRNEIENEISDKKSVKRTSYDPTAPRAKGARMIYYEEHRGEKGVKATWDGMSTDEKRPYEIKAMESKAEANVKRESLSPNNGKRKSPAKSKTGKDLYLEDTANKARVKDTLPEDANKAKDVKDALVSEWNNYVKAKDRIVETWNNKARDLEKSIQDFEKKFRQGASSPAKTSPKAPTKKTETEKKENTKTVSEKPASTKRKAEPEPKSEDELTADDDDVNFIDMTTDANE